MERHEWDAAYSGPELVWGAGPNRFVVAEASALPPGRALDLATGEGRNAIWLAELGWRVTGVDFSAAGLARAASLAAQRGVAVDWVEADILEYQPSPAAFDLVLIAYLHLPRPELERVLAAAASAVAPGGTLLVIGHDLENLDRGHGGPQDRRVLYTPELVVAAVPGLIVRTAERRPRPVPGEAGGADGERHAIDTVVVAVAPEPNEKQTSRPGPAGLAASQRSRRRAGN